MDGSTANMRLVVAAVAELRDTTAGLGRAGAANTEMVVAAVAGLRDAQTANMETVVKVIAGPRDASTANMEMVVAAVAGLRGVNTANMDVVLAAVAGIRSAVAGRGLGRQAVRVDVAGVADAIERLRVSHHLSGSWPEEAVGRRTRRVCGGGDAGGELIVRPFPPIVTPILTKSPRYP